MPGAVVLDDIRCDANDRSPLFRRVFTEQPQVFAQRTLVRPELGREALVHDRDWRVETAVGIGKLAA